MEIVTSLSFQGQCREAFEFYAKVLGGKITAAGCDGFDVTVPSSAITSRNRSKPAPVPLSRMSPSAASTNTAWFEAARCYMAACRRRRCLEVSAFDLVTAIHTKKQRL